MPGAAPVIIATAARAGNVVTITTAAPHGLIANQGFQLSGVADGTFNLNSTILAVPDATHFTFKQNAPNASSNGGSVAPAKQVVQGKYQTEQAAYAALVTQPGAFAGNWFDGAGWGQ